MCLWSKATKTLLEVKAATACTPLGRIKVFLMKTLIVHTLLIGADSSRVFRPDKSTNFFVFVIVDNQNGVQVFVGRPEKPVSGNEILDRDEDVGCTEPGAIFHRYFRHCEGLGGLEESISNACLNNVT